MPTPSNPPIPKFDFAEPTKQFPSVPDAFKAPPPQSITKFSPPPPTPIFPRLINPPPASTPISPPAPFNAARRTGGRIAGSFKMPLGSGASARAGAAVVGRRIPYVALAFLAYDAYQLACSLQLIPGSACPRPENPNPGGTPPLYEGGQCACAIYRVSLSYINKNDGDLIQASGTYRGSILEVGVHSILGGYSGIGAFCQGIGHLGCQETHRWVDMVSFGSDQTANITVSNITIVRIDGGLDNCGNIPPAPEPKGLPEQINNIINFNRNINLNFNIPSPKPPTPQPKLSPRIISPPSPFPDININFGDNYFGGGDTDYDFDIDFNFSPAPKGNYNDYPDIFNNFPPSPQPQTKDPDPFPKENPPPKPAPQPKPLPELPPPLPDKLPENSTDQDKYIYRQNKETLDKVYKANAEILEIQEEQLKQRKILENIQSLLDFEVEGSQLIKRCDDIEIFYSYKDKVLKAINKQLQHVQTIEQTIINEVCEVQKESIVASPDWWQVRLRADVPQIALVFRALGTRTYHKITLPHPLNVNKLTAPPIPSYKKGNWQGEIVCVDNSKFLVNCETKLEAERVVNVALSLMDPLFTGMIPRLYFAERKGITVSTANMLATSALYFSKGQQNTMPDWRVAFNYL